MTAALLDEKVIELYGLPLDEFTAARDGRARELKKAGDAPAAKAVKALVKPTRTAWMTNQAVRRAPELAERLLAATQEIAAAQRALGPNNETQARFHDARAQQQHIIASLLLEASAALAEAGMTADQSALDRVNKNLAWGAVSEDDCALLRQGRLVRDVNAPGFAALAGLAAPVPSSTSPPTHQPHAPRSAHTPRASAETPKPAVDASQAAHARLLAEARHAEERRTVAAQAALNRLRAETLDARHAVERAESENAAARRRFEAAAEELDAAQAALTASEARHQEAITTLNAREAAERAAADKL